MSDNDKHLNGVELSKATGLGEWVIRAIKKANKLFAAQGREPLIFTGRYSTPAKVSKWFDDHPDFVATRVLAPQNQLRAKRAPQPRPLRQGA